MLEVIAVIRTCFPTKFGIPRQAGLTDNTGRIVFTPKYRSPDAIRGLEDFSHIWLIWEFSENRDKGTSLTVRPPRLGGNTRMGVFATRSPFRPNNLGLSCVEIERIDYDCKDAPVIYVRGADMLDGTPIVDIKPYLPFADSRPDAKGGFAGEVYENALEVLFTQESEDVIKGNTKAELISVLSQDPRPHYHDDPERVYAFEYDRYKIKFTVKDNVLTVKEIIEL